MVATKEDLSTWDNFQWRRRMEAFGHNDEAVIAAGPGGEAEGIWQVQTYMDTGIALANGLPKVNSGSSPTKGGRRRLLWVSGCDICTSTSWALCRRSNRTPRICISARRRSLVHSSLYSRHSGACILRMLGQPTLLRLSLLPGHLRTRLSTQTRAIADG